MPRNLVVLIPTLFLLASGYGGWATQEWYVALEGKDSWSGRLSAPNSERTDGPFATLERARDALQVLRKIPLYRIICLQKDR